MVCKKCGKQDTRVHPQATHVCGKCGYETPLYKGFITLVKEDGKNGNK